MASVYIHDFSGVPLVSFSTCGTFNMLYLRMYSNISGTRKEGLESLLH